MTVKVSDSIKQGFTFADNHSVNSHDSKIPENKNCDQYLNGEEIQSEFGGKLFQNINKLFKVSAHDKDSLLEVMEGVMKKPSVNLDHLVPELRSQFTLIYEVFAEYGYADKKNNPVVITSGNDYDGHVTHSYHYRDRAIDIRGKHIPDKILLKIGEELQERLGADFRVLVELYSRKMRDWDHIHIAYIATDSPATVAACSC